jgi:uncharacterized MnhB-related membrane protein
MATLVYVVLAICVLGGAWAAVKSRNLLRAAIALGIGSAALALLF